MSRLQKAGYSPDMDHFTVGGLLITQYVIHGVIMVSEYEPTAHLQIPVFVDEGNAVFSAVLNINENDTLNLEFLQVLYLKIPLLQILIARTHFIVYMLLF